VTVFLNRVGAESVAIHHAWRPRDCSLYALAVGAGIDDVAFTTEGNAGVAQRVYPTFAFAIVAEVAAQWEDPCFGTGDFALEHVVLGEQGLTIHRPLQTSGDVAVRTRVAGIHEKGSAALIVLDQRASDAATGEPVFTSTVDLLVRGEGGFGGDARPPTGRGAMPPGPCDVVVDAPTLAVQTLLYRHGGNDANPLHVDTAFARRAGLRGPILSGQNTLGIACRAIVHAIAGGDPDSVRSIGGRFVAPAYNGDPLRVELWLDPADPAAAGGRAVRFRVLDPDGQAVVDRGLAELA
jgi:acyl dehydratase